MTAQKRNSRKRQALEELETHLWAKRDLLQYLYDIALSQWDSHKRLGETANSIKAAHKAQPHELTALQTRALVTAQDAANAFVLILDYTMRRFWKRAMGDNFALYQKSGLVAYQGAGKLHSVVMRFADQVRHLEVTFGGGSLWPVTENAIRKAGEDPAHGSSCCAFLENMNRKHGSYEAVENFVLASCKRAVR